MQTRPELLELCGGVVMPHSVKEVRFDLHEISAVASPPSQALGFEKSDAIEMQSLFRLSTTAMWFQLLMGC
jgi:hypothetical protein